jgi:predicted CoA-substrate-specific enzyme activase
MYAAGVDVGSTQTKAIVVDENGKIAARGLVYTGANVVQAAEKAFHTAIEEGKIPDEEVEYVVGTGYGRYRVTFGNTQVTEISCHGRAAVHMFPGTRTVVDMGGQDTKAIRVSDSGEILDFCMNDKCAAGTGRFLGAAAVALDIPLDDLGSTALKSQREIKISTTCTVFAESEVLSWLGKGKKIEDILWGVHTSIASRASALLRRVGVEDEVTFTGGVTRNCAMVKALEERLGISLNVSDDSHFMGALGAALFALDHVRAARVPASKEAKAVLLDDAGAVLGSAVKSTGFRLAEVSKETYAMALEAAGLSEADVEYVVATGFGRHQVSFKDVTATDLTAAARGAHHFFPGTATVLDVGGQTMKVSRIDEQARVTSFRLNDKCAAGTGAFLEKTAHYMGFSTEEIGSLMVTSREAVPISGVCAVFAESEVINHLSQGVAPSDIMQGAIESLVGRSVQLMKRVKGEPEFTLVGGILRFPTFATAVREALGATVNVPEGDMCQLSTALGAAVLGQRRLVKLAEGATRGADVGDAARA